MSSISVSIEPDSHLIVSNDKVLFVLLSVLEKEIGASDFLKACGAKISISEGIDVEFSPISQLRPNPISVTMLMKRILEHRINDNEFLRSCNIQLEI